MGFIQQLLQQAQAGQSLPQQSAQSRFGTLGLMDSMRNMTPPSVNLPSQASAQAQPSGGFGSGIQQLLERLRQQAGTQGVGTMMPRPTTGQSQTPLVHPVMPSTGVSGWSPPTSYPRPQIPAGGGIMPGAGIPGQGLAYSGGPLINPKPPLANTSLPTVGGTRTNPTYSFPKPLVQAGQQATQTTPGTVPAPDMSRMGSTLQSRYGNLGAR